MTKIRVFSLIFAVVLAVVGVSAALAQEEMLENTVNIGGNDALGPFLVGPNGMTLYFFSRDPLGESVCEGQCLDAWPPLLVESADELTKQEGIAGELSTVERSDGTLQVALNGLPLYYWFMDTAPGEATGDRVMNVWWIARPAGIYPGPVGENGFVLVGPTGMTLYMFTRDAEGVSNCTGDCAVNWPPLTVESEDEILAQTNVPGELGTITREDGALQVTYNGMPLYYWQGDTAPGDMTGEGVNDVWFTIAPETVVLRNSAELGDYLAGPSGYTLYLFANDTEGVSNCSGDCASNWPPLTVLPGEKLVAGPGVEGELGTIEREGGGTQVTYNGLPVYYWAQDTQPGDTTGEGVGGNWTVVRP
jgi:predicted lipoprotein with Yx(FWY)xxD motif